MHCTIPYLEAAALAAEDLTCVARRARRAQQRRRRRGKGARQHGDDGLGRRVLPPGLVDVRVQLVPVVWDQADGTLHHIIVYYTARPSHYAPLRRAGTDEKAPSARMFP